jgi:hypothetical protein
MVNPEQGKTQHQLDIEKAEAIGVKDIRYDEWFNLEVNLDLESAISADNEYIMQDTRICKLPDGKILLIEFERDIVDNYYILEFIEEYVPKELIEQTATGMMFAKRHDSLPIRISTRLAKLHETECENYSFEIKINDNSYRSFTECDEGAYEPYIPFFTYSTYWHDQERNLKLRGLIVPADKNLIEDIQFRVVKIA